VQTSPGVAYLIRRLTPGRRAELLEEQAQVARASLGDRTAVDAVLSANFAYVVHIARAFRGSTLPFEDVVAEGCVGLLKAIRRYRPESGTRFMTYASFWVRKSIREAVAVQPHTIHVPRYAREHGAAVPRVIRLDLPRNPDETLTVADRLRDPDPPAVEMIARQRQMRNLRRHVVRLTPRDRSVIAWRYGLDGQPEQTLNEIARRLRLSRERVRQIEVAALAQLGKLMRSRIGVARPR
jgi:RNA polymerase sigma factor (sigma-70 family)